MVVAPGKKTVTTEPDLVFHVCWCLYSPTAHFRNILWVRWQNIRYFFFFLTKGTRSPGWHLFVNQICCNKYLSLHKCHSEWSYQWLPLGPLVFTLCSPWWFICSNHKFCPDLLRQIYVPLRHTAFCNKQPHKTIWVTTQNCPVGLSFGSRVTIYVCDPTSSLMQ